MRPLLRIFGRRAWLAHLRSQLTAEQGTFVAEYSLSPSAKSWPLKSAQLPDGLFAWHVVSDQAGNRRVVTYWNTEQQFLIATQELAAALGGATANTIGWVGQLNVRQPPLLQRLSLAKGVLWLSALVGAVNVIIPFFYEMVAAPSIAVNSTRTVDAFQGHPFELRIALRNEIRAPHSNIHVSATLQSKMRNAPVHSAQLTVSEKHIPELGAFATSELTLSGLATDSGLHTATVTVVAAAGPLRAFLFGPKTFEKAIDVNIWPSRPQGLPLSEKSGNPPYGTLVGSIAVGREAKLGIECELTLVELRHDIELMNLFQEPVSSESETLFGAHGADRRVIAWTTGTLPEKTMLRFRMILRGSANTAWEEMAKKASLVCDYRR